MLMKMFEKRLRGYRAIGYTTGEVPPGLRGLESKEKIRRDLKE
jgi:hypothetical protein